MIYIICVLAFFVGYLVRANAVNTRKIKELTKKINNLTVR